MSKNKRKRRLKEEDFKKKKLKVGKKLPMPDNLTRTSFKARSINISQQNIKQDGTQHEGNVSGRNLKDLLSCCAHYNTQAREDALLGLKNLFQSNNFILKQNLNTILQRTLRLITDIESSVRKAFLMLISVMFKFISETEISPFFSNILAYLCSAMTHLNENIRLDSMKFLDQCFTFFPQLVKANPKSIIMNFMNVISVEKSDNAKNRVVKSGLKAKVMMQKTQLEVLRRFSRLLCVVFGDDCESSSIDEIDGSLGPTLISNFSLKTTTSEYQTLATNENWLKEFISRLVPVLFEYWVECGPAEFKTNLIPINKVSIPIQIMKKILEIFVTLVESLKKNSSVQESFDRFFDGDLSVQFDTYFTKAFPLSFTFKPFGRKSGKVEFAENITDVQLNILMARLLCYHVSKIKNATDLPRWTLGVLSYIQEVLPSKNTDRQQSKLIASDIQSLTNLVKAFLLNLPKQFENEKVRLLQSMYCLFERSFRDSNTKNVLLDFLAEIVNGAGNPKNSMITILDEWLTSLLDILIKENSPDLQYKIFFICKSGILQQYPRLTVAMVEVLPCVFTMANFSKLSEKIQRLVIEVLYHCGQVPSREFYGILAKLCDSGCLPLPVSKYLLFVIHQLVHSKPSSSLTITIADYLSFILSIAMGHTQDELKCIQARDGHPSCFSFKEISELYTIVAEFESDNANPQITMESLEHANQVIEIICELLAQSDYSSRFLEMLETPLRTVLSRYTTLPLLVVYRLLYLIKKLLQSTNKRCAPELLTSVATWCAIIWHFLVKVWALFGKANFIQTLTNHLQRVISELCKSSETILQSMLDLFIPCTMPGCKPQLTCQVLTEMLKEMQGSFTSVHQSMLKDLCKNLERACNNEMLDSQIFSDFKYQYQCCVKKLLVCGQV